MSVVNGLIATAFVFLGVAIIAAIPFTEASVKLPRWYPPIPLFLAVGGVLLVLAAIWTDVLA